MKDVDISIQNISKIEGHAHLDVKVRGNEVQEVKLQLAENKRFFTKAIEGRTIDTLSQSVARICGTCSIAHTMCCIEAIEHALDITPTPQTQLLKELTMHGLMIRDHALHIYLFSLPDVFNKDSVLDFEGEESTFLYDSFDIKRAGNMLCTAVAGRAVHAPFPLVGGFANIPEKDELKKCITELKKAREKIFRVLEVYYHADIDYTRDTTFVGLISKKFDFLKGEIQTSDGTCIPEIKYFDYLEKKVIPYSQAVGYSFKGKTHMVGALARLNLGKQHLHPATKRDAKKYLSVFPSTNVFHNNLAQAIEIVHSIDRSIEILENNSFAPEEPVEVKPKESEGIGVIEAPRGTLFYKLHINKDGTIQKGTIVVPTQQNQTNIELDIKALVQNKLETLSREQLEYEMEKLIRAYDPCISCATHFLKVHWV